MDVDRFWHCPLGITDTVDLVEVVQYITHPGDNCCDMTLHTVLTDGVQEVDISYVPNDVIAKVLQL